LSDQQRSLPLAPRLATGCTPPGSVPAPKIISPVAGETRRMVPGMPSASQEVPFEADSTWDGPLSWFVNGEWLGEAESEGRVWWTPTVGRHQVVVRDGAGRSSAVDFVVEAGVSSFAQR